MGSRVCVEGGLVWKGGTCSAGGEGAVVSYTSLDFHHTHTRTGTYLLEVLSPKYYFSQVRSLASFFLFFTIERTHQPPHPSPLLCTPDNKQIKISVRPEVEDDAGKILCLEYKYPGMCCVVFSSYGLFSFLHYLSCVCILPFCLAWLAEESL